MPAYLNVEGIPTWRQQKVQILYQRRLFLIRKGRNNNNNNDASVQDNNNEGGGDDEATWLKNGAKTYLGELKEIREAHYTTFREIRMYDPTFLDPLLREFNDDAGILTAILRITIYPDSFLTAVSPRLQGNKEFVFQVLGIYPWAGILRHASPNLLADKEFMMKAVQVNGLYLKHASKPLQDDEELASLATTKQATSLEYASPRLRDNEQFVLNAIRGDIDSYDAKAAIEHASPRLKNNYQVVLATVRKNGHALEHASVPLQQNINIVVDAELSKIKIPANDATFTFLTINNSPLPPTDDIVNQSKTPLSIFPYLLEEAKHNPIIIYYCLKNRSDLIPTTTITSPQQQSNVNDANVEDPASIPPAEGVDPSNGDKKKRKRSKSSEKKHEKKKSKN